MVGSWEIFGMKVERGREGERERGREGEKERRVNKNNSVRSNVARQEGGWNEYVVT
jgi:hypothetical protein